MNKAKEVYLDKDGNMIKEAGWRDIKRHPEKYTEVSVDLMPQKLSLTLVGLGWQNSGVTFWFKGDDGREYPIPVGEFDIEYLKQGTVHSIGFKDGE